MARVENKASVHDGVLGSECSDMRLRERCVDFRLQLRMWKGITQVRILTVRGLNGVVSVAFVLIIRC